MTGETKPCESCGEPIVRPWAISDARWAMRRHCNNTCRYRASRARRAAPKPKPARPTKECIKCGAIVEKPSNENKEGWEKRQYCSRACKDDRSDEPGRECQTCGKLFYRDSRSTYKNFWRRKPFCGYICQTKSRSQAEYHASEAMFLVETGEWPPRAAERVGYTMETLQKTFRTMGMPDMANRFNPRMYDKVDAA